MKVGEKQFRFPPTQINPISFMGCIYMAEELLNWLFLWSPNIVS